MGFQDTTNAMLGTIGGFKFGKGVLENQKETNENINIASKANEHAIKRLSDANENKIRYQAMMDTITGNYRSAQERIDYENALQKHYEPSEEVKKLNEMYEKHGELIDTNIYEGKKVF